METPTRLGPSKAMVSGPGRAQCSSAAQWDRLELTVLLMYLCQLEISLRYRVEESAADIKASQNAVSSL